MSNISISIKSRKPNTNQIVLSAYNCVKNISRGDEVGKKIVLLVSEHTNVSPELLMHHSRCQSHIADARQLAMYLLHVGAGFSMSEVGRFFGRDRTTVSHACNKVEDRRDLAEFDELVGDLEDELGLFSLENCESLRS